MQRQQGALSFEYQRSCRAGTTFISGLRGNATLARQPGTASAYWLTSESTQITEGNQTFGQIALSPKTVGEYTEVSRLLQEQTGALAEKVVRRDLASVTSTALDVAALADSGTAGQPLGIVGTPSIGGFTGASIAWADALNAQTDVLTANAGGDGASFAYVTTPAVAAVLAGRQAFSDKAAMWEGPLWQGTVAGARAYSTTSAPSATIVAGNWSELIIAEWNSVIELVVSERANFKAGIIGIAAFYTVDVAVADVGAFSVASSVS